MKGNFFSIFVNTTDRFEDCWEPFFKLFTIFWPDYKGKIYLNTEKKSFVYPGLDIVSIKNCERSGDANTVTWSECLQRGWDMVDNDVILYLQEDYFFNAPVQNNKLDYYAKLVLEENISCLHLSSDSGRKSLLISRYPDLKEINQNAAFRISCQAAFWKKDALLKYVRKNENAWQFEYYGTMRARLIKDSFFYVSVVPESILIPYIQTGVINGKWKYEVVGLFAKHDIDVDFTKRGFRIQESPTFFKRIKDKIIWFPKALPSKMDLWKQRIKKLVGGIR